MHNQPVIKGCILHPPSHWLLKFTGQRSSSTKCYQMEKLMAMKWTGDISLFMWCEHAACRVIEYNTIKRHALFELNTFQASKSYNHNTHHVRIITLYDHIGFLKEKCMNCCFWDILLVLPTVLLYLPLHLTYLKSISRGKKNTQVLYCILHFYCTAIHKANIALFYYIYLKKLEVKIKIHVQFMKQNALKIHCYRLNYPTVYNNILYIIMTILHNE